jgi:hypothetical protein
MEDAGLNPAHGTIRYLNMGYRNNDKKRQWYRDHYQRHRAYLISLREKPCVDCNQTYPWYVMEFDHVPERGPKLFDIAAKSRPGKKTLEDELAKCDVICANCHKVRTYNRRKTDLHKT